MSGQDYGPGGYPPPDEHGYGGRDRPDPGPRDPRYDQSMGGVRGAGGDHGPAGLPPEPARRGPSSAAIVTIVALALALIILAVWWFTRDGGQDNAEPVPAATTSAPAATEEASPTPSEEPTTEAATSEAADSEPVESEAPSDEVTSGDDEASPAPAPVPSAPSVDPGDDFNVEEYEILPDTLPPTVGDWQHTMVGGFDAYVRPDNAYVMVAGQGTDEAQVDGFRQMMADVREFEGGFCGTLEDDGVGSFDQCYFRPGKAPDRFYNVMSAGEPPATLDELQEIAEAIASFE